MDYILVTGVTSVDSQTGETLTEECSQEFSHSERTQAVMRFERAVQALLDRAHKLNRSRLEAWLYEKGGNEPVKHYTCACADEVPFSSTRSAQPMRLVEEMI